mmetsp:Transcript_12879/g.22793  ORF Transcript_12879/g.22793 Transcript_12879/m.22793 type:complete len:203 (-) Transcript_12879:1535-2143(-)
MRRNAFVASAWKSRSTSLRLIRCAKIGFLLMRSTTFVHAFHFIRPSSTVSSRKTVAQWSRTVGAPSASGPATQEKSSTTLLYGALFSGSASRFRHSSWPAMSVKFKFNSLPISRRSWMTVWAVSWVLCMFTLLAASSGLRTPAGEEAVVLLSKTASKVFEISSSVKGFAPWRSKVSLMSKLESCPSGVPRPIEAMSASMACI